MKQGIVSVLIVSGMAVGCGSAEKADRDFATSGSREADQRAEQRMIKQQQLEGEKGVGENVLGGENIRKTLYVRLGGEAGISAIAGDFVSRALADPRINWQRKGVERGGMLGIGGESAEWSATPESIAKLKKHIAQFLSLSTGGPIKYEGKGMAEAHKGMKITNAEYDASIGAFKASMDSLGIPIDEQRELLGVIETTMAQIVEVR